MSFTNLDQFLNSIVDGGITPLASMLVYKDGREVYRTNLGVKNVITGSPNENDTLFRIFSMTKVITTVALMQLFEQGKVTLSDPVSRYIPSFAHQKVWHANERGEVYYTDPVRENTLHDLLNMTSGIPYYHPGRTVVEDMMSKVWERMDDCTRAGEPWDTLTAVNEIGKNPLMFDPGTHFHYGLGIDVIGGVIEKVSGMRLGDYFKKYIFEPLGMTDTDFYVPVEKQGRLVPYYQRHPEGGFFEPNRFQDLRQLARPAYEEGGDGIVTTLDDYMTFARMLLGKGTLNGVRILGRKTVEYMSHNHLPQSLVDELGQSMKNLRGYGFGLGCRVNLDPSKTVFNGSEGEFGWFGNGGSWFCVDPKEQMAALFLTQCVYGKGPSPDVLTRLWAALYSDLQ